MPTSPAQSEGPTLSRVNASSDPAAPADLQWRGYFYIALATFFWAAAATAGKAVFDGSLFTGRAVISPLLLTQARTTVTVLVLMSFMLARRGREFFSMNLRDLALCGAAGTLGVAGSNFLYYSAIQKSTVAIAVTLQYTAPVWVLVYMVSRGRERPSVGGLCSVPLALAGVALTVRFFHFGLGTARSGAILGLLASFSFAFYNIVAPALIHRHHPLKVMMYTLLAAALLWNCVNPPWRFAAQGYNAAQCVFLFIFACLSMLLPYICYFTGLKYLNPMQAVIASCLEPVFAILFASLFVHEAVAPLQVVGIMAVLAATAMAQFGPGGRTRPSSSEDILAG